MAIKVVHRGTPPEEIVYRTTCGTCKSILEFNKSDAPLVGPQVDQCYVLSCPVCKDKIYLAKLTKVNPY